MLFVEAVDESLRRLRRRSTCGGSRDVVAPAVAVDVVIMHH